MSFSAVSLEGLLADFDLTAAKWKRFFTEYPAAATVPTDINGAGTVGALAWHLYLASVVHSQRLLGEPVADFAATAEKDKDIAGAWEMHALGSANLHRFLAATNDQALDVQIPVLTHLGTEMPMSRRKLCMHIFVHAIRHWAQIGPLVRQNGYPADWPQDISFSEAIR
jgi:uncharacterized damage-inducible protein DinB